MRVIENAAVPDWRERYDYELANGHCPRCSGTTQYRMGTDADGELTIAAEQCSTCGWVIEFFEGRLT